MAVSRKIEREIERTKYLEKIAEFLSQNCDEEVLRVKSNEICFPIVGCEGKQDYQMKLSEKEKKKIEAEKKKAEKIRKDAEIRKKKQEIAEKGE